MIYNMDQTEKEIALVVAKHMIAAARTAPKASGKDKIVSAILTDEDLNKLADEMDKAGREYNLPFFCRDAENMRNSHCVVLIGSKLTPFGLEHCGMCGFEDCKTMHKNGGRCVFNITDLGIAVGSAVSIAADNRIDNRVMYSAGRAAVRLKLLGDGVEVCYGIPLWTGSKSIFFDRNPGAVLR